MVASEHVRIVCTDGGCCCRRTGSVTPSAGSAATSRPARELGHPPTLGEVITSEATRNSYTMGRKIGEGHFGLVYDCVDVWNNNLAAKVLKPLGPYEKIKASAESELHKLTQLRHPHITYVFDAFEFRETFYIITERCYCPLTSLFALEAYSGFIWIKAIARCLLQAVHYIHLNQYAHQDIHLGNVFAAFAKNEMNSEDPGAIQFKLGDLGVAKLFSEIDAVWSKISNALKRLDFRPRNLLAQLLSESSRTCTIRVRRSSLGSLWNDLGSHACLHHRNRRSGTSTEERISGRREPHPENPNQRQVVVIRCRESYVG
jgi:serine/threonine protein kinase